MKLYLAIKAIGRVSAKSKAVVDDDGRVMPIRQQEARSKDYLKNMILCRKYVLFGFNHFTTC